MPSSIDPTLPTDSAIYAGDLRANLQAAHDEIEALQTAVVAAQSDANAAGIDASQAIQDAADALAAAEAPLEVGDLDGLAIDMGGEELISPVLRDWSETLAEPLVETNQVTVDVSAANAARIMLDDDAALVLTGAPTAPGGLLASVTLIVEQDGTGGHSLTWPAEVLWPSGDNPSVTPTAGAIDVFAFITDDGGTTWFGFVGGLGFA